MVFYKFQKSFLFNLYINPWYKLKKRGISVNMVNCITGFRDGNMFCDKYGEAGVKDFIEPKKRGVTQGCSLSLYLFNNLYVIL